MTETDNGIVYHYCSLETFKSIIENKCLWLCDVRKSNDSAECMVLPNAIADELEHRFPVDHNLLPDLTIADRERSRILHNLRNETDITDQQVYNISFSQSADQLSQWRGYANDGAGFCIGFDNAYLNELSKCGFMFQPICYDPALLAYNANLYINQITEYLDSLPTPPAPQLLDAKQYLEICKKGTEIISQVQQQSPLFKLESFHEENEYRLCFSAKHITISSDSILFQSIDHKINQRLTGNQHFSISPLQFRVTSFNLQSYYKLSFEPIKDEFIREIIIGPKSPIQETDLWLFLAANGYSAKISGPSISLSLFPAGLRIRRSLLTYR